jgi:hypothetical protein
VDEEKIFIEGEEFQKKDIEHISKKVLYRCNFLHPKNKNNAHNLKVGDGKLMITSGLTVNDFLKKHKFTI